MSTPSSNQPGYLGTIARSARTVFEGMAVTFSYLFRRPITVQYPDRTPQPIENTLPSRYRGLLEVDIDVCTACKACERDCPIGCIRIEVGKVGATRVMTRFDIDLGKCMYCGLCVDACPAEAAAPGDGGLVTAIRFTREFQAVVPDLSSLTFRFVRPGDQVVPNKVKKGEATPSRPRGEIARQTRRKALEVNPPAVRVVREAAAAAATATEAAVATTAATTRSSSSATADAAAAAVATAAAAGKTTAAAAPTDKTAPGKAD